MLSRIVAKLEEQGLLRRLTDEADGRVCRVEVTEAGRALHSRVRSERTDVLSHELDLLSARTGRRSWPPFQPSSSLAERVMQRPAPAGALGARDSALRTSSPGSGGPMSRVFSIGRRTFSALKVPNFRRYYIGQAISMVGTWMQSVAQSWLVYVLTHSATDLGLAVALQTLAGSAVSVPTEASSQIVSTSAGS